MLILGLHDGHNASACLVKNGEVLAALAEERLTNKKNQSGTPILAARKIFAQTGIDPSSVDQVAVSSLLRIGDPITLSHPALKIMELIPFPIPYVHVFKFLRDTSGVKSLLRDLNISAPIRFVEHHTTHAAGAYFQRPWKSKSLILTLDGAGDGLSATVSIGEGSQIKRIAATSYYDSLSNNLYSEITGFLGMKRWEHEYKLMGLAPYGKPEYVLPLIEPLFSLENLGFKNNTGHYVRGLQPLLRKILAEQRFDNIAAATQKHFENLVITWVKNAISNTKINHLVCSGGSFLNVKTNQLIRELKEVADVYFDPACDDVGTSVGAALSISGTGRPLANLYLGAEYLDPEIFSAIKKSKLSRQTVKPKNMTKSIAGLLASGQIVARFSGHDEFGPRALGNRSILADPRRPDIIRKINFAIKMRDFWMPFAPAILQEDCHKYLKNYRPAPYMIESFHTTPAALTDIIAGLHPFDLTCRPQTVSPDTNPEYYSIIKEFKKITGVGAVLNTSFNLHGFPIVGTPEAATNTFLNSSLDALAIGGYLIHK